MLFIKNLTNLEGSEFRVILEEREDISTISIKIADNDPVAVLSSEMEGVYKSLKKSMDYVNNILGAPSEDTVECCLLSNKPTEINFLVKDTKTVIKDSELFPVEVGSYEEEDAKANVHYPRDMILFIAPNGEDDDCQLVVDRRNLGAPIITKDIGDYRIIALFVKWPIWMRLKFPAYAYVENKHTDSQDKESYTKDIMGPIKLGFKTEKKIIRNQVQDVDGKEAFEYLSESFRLLREAHEKKEAEKRPAKPKTGNFNRDHGNFNKDHRSNNGYNKNRDQKKGNYNKSYSGKSDNRNSGRVGFPSKFAGKGNGGNRKPSNNKRNKFYK